MAESPESSHHQKEGVGVESSLVWHRIDLLLLYLLSLLSTCGSSFRKRHQIKYIHQELDRGPIGPRSRVCIEYNQSAAMFGTW